jgi:hypothetical protein
MEEDGLDDLEKEVICLRELLSHLKMEESYLIQGSSAPAFIQDEGKLQKESLLLQKKRKVLLLSKTLLGEAPELKKRSLYPLQKIRPKAKVKKKSLLLEDQNA